MSLKLSKLMLFALVEMMLLEKGEHPKKPRADKAGILRDELRAASPTLRGLVGRKLVVRRGQRYTVTGVGQMVAYAFVSGTRVEGGRERLDLNGYLWGDKRFHSEIMAERFPNR